jgi:hypothetical protein
MTVNPLIPVSIVIAASANPVTAGTSVTFTATPSNGGATPSYQWKVNGISTGTNTPDYSYVPVNNDVITCVLTSNAPCATGSPATSNTITMTVTPVVPVNTTVTGTIPVGTDTCYSATQTLTVAGGMSTFLVQGGGSATMIAGQNILYLPGTTIELNGYMHGYITLTNEYCGTMPAPIVAVMAGGINANPIVSEQSMFKVYPNPTTGAFTLEINGETDPGTVYIEIFGMCGDNVLNTDLFGSKKTELSLVGKPAGIYLLRVISGDRIETRKIIKQ